ncbi:hypothetical protein BKA70DRAFT_1462351, partial [Coprinopsis sp. MPI-PUGE-AT-0042]
INIWDDIGCPWEDAKQEFGTSLTIIGFWVDYSRGSISLSPNSINNMKDAIRDFLSFDGRNPPLRRWQQITGHLNWALNVIPWGRPALSEMYRKMAGKTHSKAGIFLNREVHADLQWFSNELDHC